MIGSLMYLTASRPDIMFVVCVCARHQVTPKECHLHAVKRIFRKSTTRGCQFLGRRLISWQCKKQTIVATSTTEAEYVAAASGCGQVLWIQNQLLDYGDCYEKKLINVDHIHTDNNVADLLTKPFDVGRFQYLVAEHVMKRLLWCIKSGITSCPTSQQISTPSHTPTPRRLTKGAIRIAQSKALTPGADEPASPPRDDSHGEAFPTATSLDAGQDRENIPKTSAMPHESSLMVTSLSGDEGSLQLKLNELMDFCTKLQSQHSQMAAKIQIHQFPLIPVDIATIALAGVATASGNIPTASGNVPTAAVFTTTSITTPYTRRTRASKGIIIEPSHPTHTTSIPTFSTKEKGKEKMVARELEEEFAQEDQRIREQATRDAEIARIQAEEELGSMIAGLNRGNELIAKYLSEYEQAESGLSLEEKMELINELVKYQKNIAEILRYQAQQSKPSTKKEKRNFYMSILRSHAGWKTKDFRGMSFEQIEEKFIPVWKQMEDFVPMNSKAESERQTKDPKELSEEELKKMMEIVPVEEVYIEALQVKRPIIAWEVYSEGERILVKEAFSTEEPTEDKANELWVDLKRLYEPDPKDQLWALQRYMHDPLEWKLYDTCGVHHVFTVRGHEIFMLVEKDYPLTKGLATVMISNKLQVDQYSEMANELIVKIYNIANSPR
ncbi:hypothetical protein Tco_0703091 [Tanacetum coccineum]|uniref:Uncharacterized protein n=1 Tax=Tanacetum coccineum TaxID=301880 RepID=A0ABQ4XYV4_9ASTR